MKLALCLLTLLSLSAVYAAKLGPPPSSAADTATAFLGDLDKADGDAAIKLWDSASATDKVKARIDRMSAKVKKLGGIKRIDVRPCEPRRMEKFEKQTGEKIAVVPVEIICKDENLILAVFSIRQTGAGDRIFQLESLKEWGGTASLDDELPYSH